MIFISIQLALALQEGNLSLINAIPFFTIPTRSHSIRNVLRMQSPHRFSRHSRSMNLTHVEGGHWLKPNS